MNDDVEELRQLYTRLAGLEKKGELGEALADYVGRISIYDMAMLCAGLGRENDLLPGPYGKKLRVHMVEKIYGGYQRMLSLKSSGAFGKLTDNVRDKAALKGFCEAMITACDELPDTGQEAGYVEKIGAVLYVLTSCFAIFVMDEPGHPVGTPFPGGFSVENRGGVYYCPVRDKEKDVKHAFCNFCPSRQADLTT